MAVAPRRSRPRPYGALLLLSLLIAALGWILYLRVTDQPLRGPFGLLGSRPAAEASTSPESSAGIPKLAEGKVRTLVPARDIPAYAKVTRDDLFDSRRGMFSFVDLDKEFAEDNGVFVTATEIVGRVMARPKRPGYVFTEADFLPKGTRPGMAGGTPAGKRALRIDVDLVRGIIGLNPGDRFDLVAARTVLPDPVISAAGVSGEAGKGPAFVGLYSEIAGRGARGAAPSPRKREPEARVDVIVQGGVVVSPIETRLVPVSSTSLTAGQVTSTRPVQEMVIALAPEEVAPLMAALRLESDLTCLARSGRPEDNADSLTPGLMPERAQAEGAEGDAARADAGMSGMPAGYEDAEFTVIETIVGGERTLTAVPKGARVGSR